MAIRLTVVGALWFVVGTALTAIAAVGVTACLRFRSTASFGLNAYLVAWVIVVSVVYLLSIARWLDRWTLLAVLTVVSLVSVATWVASGRPTPAVACWVRRFRDGCRDPILLALLVGVGLAYIYVFALAVGTAANDGDPLVYELTRAAFWRQHHGIGMLNAAYDERLDTNPPHAEIGQLVTMVLSGSGQFAAAGQFSAVIALTLAVYGVGRRVGLPGRRSAFGALLVPLLPVVLVQSWTGFTDIVFAAFLVTAVYFALGTSRVELLPFALAVGLMLGTKFLGPLLLPIVALVVITRQPPRRFPAFALAGIAGGAFGAIWYVVNALHADRVVGNVDTSGFQALGVGPTAASFGRYVLEFWDLSGAVGRDVLFYPLAGIGLLIVAAVTLRRRDAAFAPSMLAAGVLVGLLPVWVALTRELTSLLGRELWTADGNQTLAEWFATHDRQQTAADGALSWFGPVGVSLVVVAVPVVVLAARRAKVGRAAVVVAVAPALALLCVSVAIIYLPYQGRYFIGAVALSASTWGLACRWPAVKLAIATASLLTAALCLVNSLGKPSGLVLLRADAPQTVWRMERWRQQGLLRPSPPERPEIRTIRYVERGVPLAASIGIALDENDFGFPYFGKHLTRRVAIVDVGDKLPRELGWLVAAPGRRPEGCLGSWHLVYRTGEGVGWRVWRRTNPDHCASPAVL